MNPFLGSDVDRSKGLTKGSSKYGTSVAVLENGSDPAALKASIEKFKASKAAYEEQRAKDEKTLEMAQKSGEEGLIREATYKLKETKAAIKQVAEMLSFSETKLDEAVRKNTDSSETGFQQTEKTTTENADFGDFFKCQTCGQEFKSADITDAQTHAWDKGHRVKSSKTGAILEHSGDDKENADPKPFCDACDHESRDHDTNGKCTLCDCMNLKNSAENHEGPKTPPYENSGDCDACMRALGLPDLHDYSSSEVFTKDHRVHVIEDKTSNGLEAICGAVLPRKNSTAGEGVADDPDAGEISNYAPCPGCGATESRTFLCKTCKKNKVCSECDYGSFEPECKKCAGGVRSNDGDPKKEAEEIARHAEGIAHEVEEIMENSGPEYLVTYDGPKAKDVQVTLRLGRSMTDSQIDDYFKSHYTQPTKIHKIEKINNASGKVQYKSFIFVDQNGETEKVEAATESQAWDKLGKNFGMTAGDIKRMGIKLQGVVDGPLTGVMNHKGAPAPWAIPGSDVEKDNAKAEEPCPSCGLPKKMRPAGGDDNSFVCGNRQCKDFKNDKALPDGTVSEPEKMENAKKPAGHPGCSEMSSCDVCGKPMCEECAGSTKDNEEVMHGACAKRLGKVLVNDVPPDRMLALTGTNLGAMKYGTSSMVKNAEPKPVLTFKHAGIEKGAKNYGSHAMDNKADICDVCSQPIPAGTGRIGYDGGKTFHDECYDKTHP
jgi:hypothetical protein